MLIAFCFYNAVEQNQQKTNEISKEREAPESSRLEYEPNIRNNFRDINNNLDQMEEWHQRSVAAPCHRHLKLLNSSRTKKNRTICHLKNYLKGAQLSMNLTMRKIFETPKRSLAQRKKNQRSVAKPYADHLLLL